VAALDQTNIRRRQTLIVGAYTRSLVTRVGGDYLLGPGRVKELAESNLGDTEMLQAASMLRRIEPPDGESSHSTDEEYGLT